ncbi:tRNA-dihydrouridine synthase [Spongiibacter sp. KMU-158]|uniref:tRNA-dihydrouridine(16) synthase n=1 Tax=Spongiibacter pelagi TaxID=2760804 RepID=A0A927C2U6_9GAMM|nr:tRNA-dihydrouridine synthase [Spongiibacter pelagi]MBD2858997.1 tRNA-dihydrouridine synthase [Spongiibacter pelagi]
MNIHLAPMEGVVNARMRALLTQLGGIDRCVTEFVRVSGQLLPRRVFYRLCPELDNAGLTPSGIPVYMQLLGSDPACMADNAARAAELGAPGIDINFGCPAKCVNRHRGGSVLLDEPELVGEIVSSMRRAVPATTPVTAKIRLGYRDSGRLTEIVSAISEAGATELAVHARTRDDGYKPPAFWDQIAPLHALTTMPIIANGEVWNTKDYWQCRQESQSQQVMIGRGLLSTPDLAQQIKAEQAGNVPKPLDWLAILPLLEDLFSDCRQNCLPRHAGGPIKQWLGYLRRQYPEAQRLFENVKRLNCPDAIAAQLRSDRQANAA